MESNKPVPCKGCKKLICFLKGKSNSKIPVEWDSLPLEDRTSYRMGLVVIFEPKIIETILSQPEVKQNHIIHDCKHIKRMHAQRIHRIIAYKPEPIKQNQLKLF